MKILVSAKDGVLYPADKQSEKRVLQLMDGDIYDCHVNIEQVRSNPQNARYWAKLNELSDIIPEAMQAQYARAMLDQLSLEHISPQTLHEYIKLKTGVRSIAFDWLDHSAACAYYTQADEEIEKLQALALAMHQGGCNT